ncbi:hypothetical protein ONZ45_g18237 [Pleurotus djamor]|nr:hypothetical protein ONZ45_g18237 [Pleurotus djamor]
MDLSQVTTQIIPELRFLHTLDIQMSHLTSEVTDALAELPLLRSLCGTGMNDNSHLAFSDELEPESFPVLETLKLTMSMERTALCFDSEFTPPCLKTLSIEACYDAHGEHYVSTIEWVGGQLPLIESLTIYVDAEDGMGMYEHPDEQTQLLLSAMKPLYTCTRLSSLTISYPIPIVMEEDELVALVTALPTLRRLSLGQFQIMLPPSKSITNTFASGISPSILPILAPLCPSLEYLSLYMSFRNLSNSESLPVVNASTRFKSLRTFDVWESSFKRSSVMVVALFLSRILPSFCEVEYRKREEVATVWKRVVDALKIIRMAQGDVAAEKSS